MPTPRKSTSGNQPFVLTITFPSYDDASAARDLLKPMALGPIEVRPKHNKFRVENANAPRIIAIRKAMAARKSFDLPMIAAALEEAGYSTHKHAAVDWVHYATECGVLHTIEPGLYEFLPTADGNSPQAGELHIALAGNPMCAACQPEPLSCAAL